MSKIMQIFYGNDCLPYKDKDRQVHYPIIGNSFSGASLVDEIRFYVKDITDNDTIWVANAKRADGQIAYKQLEFETDTTINETYVSLQLSQWFTAKKGDLYIALNGYKGGVDIQVDNNSGLYTISGTPIIQATGSVKLAINYAPIMNNGYGEIPQISVQEALGLISTKLDKGSPNYLKVVDDIDNLNTSAYEHYVFDSDIVLAKDNGSGKYELFVVNGVYPNLAYTELSLYVSQLTGLTISASDIVISNSGTFPTTSDITFVQGGTLKSLLDAKADTSEVNALSDYVDERDDYIIGKVNDTGHSLYLVESTDPSKEYDYIIQLKNAGGAVISSVELDLPLESIITNGSYDSATKEIVLTLDNGSEVRIPVGDLVSGLVDEQGLEQALQPYVKEIEISSVLTTNDLLEQIGTNKNFVLDNMGDPLLCYISEDSGTYTISFVGKDKAYHSTFSENTLVINLLSNTTLDIDYLPIIELSASMQTLTASELEIAKQDNSVIKYNGRVYAKANETTNAYEYVSADYDISDVGENNQITKYEISVNKTTGATSMIQQFFNVYSVGEIDTKLEEYAKVDGNYQTMTVGNADALTPYGENSGANDTTPFVFQSTGGNSDVGSKAYLRSLRGNSVAFNQLCISSRATNTLNGITFTNNGDGSFSVSGEASANTTFEVQSGNDRFNLITGHKYLLFGCPSGGSSSTYDLRLSQSNMVGYDYGSGLIGTAINSGLAYVIIRVASGTNITTPIKFVPQIIDLTLMFGAGNEPTSVVEFNRLFPKTYYPYNAGELLSCKVNGIKNVGYNAYDNANPNDYIKVISGQTYTLEGSGTVALYDYNKNLLSDTFVSESALSNSCRYVKITGGDNTTCFHLTWDGSRTGYEPYESKTYALPNIELRSARNAYDELKPDGTLIRRIGVVDLGSLSNWDVSSTIKTNSGLSSLVKKPSANNQLANIHCSKYITSGAGDSAMTSSDLRIGVNTGGVIRIYDTSLSGLTNSQVREKLSGVYLFYELATPTETQDDDYKYQEVQDIDDFGTQEFLYDSDITIPVPQGNEFFYPVDYKAFIDSLGGREDIEYDATKIVSQEQLANYLKTISGYDDTKTQTLKNVNGTFTWVDDE